MPNLVETVVWAMAASLNPYKCPISSSVFASGMAFSNNSMAFFQMATLNYQIFICNIFDWIKLDCCKIFWRSTFFIFFQKTDCKWGVSKEYKEKKKVSIAT